MSLRVWLPLNGDLRNNGLSDYSLSMYRGTETYNNSGKIGKCFYSNGVNTIKILNIIPDFYKYSGYSLCAWAYVESQNTSHSGSAIISAGNWNSQVLNLSLSDWSTDHYTKLRVSGTNWNNTYSYNFAKNTWYHIVVSSDGNKTYAYVNGTLIGNAVSGFLPSSIEGNDICIGGATYYGGMQFFGRINDVRIYDHVLSLKEIKELSKGLVCHYPLISNGNENLLKYTYVNSINKNLLGTKVSSRWNSLNIEKIEGYYCYHYPSEQSSTWFYTGYWYKPLEANTTYTYSAWIYFTSSASFSFTSLGHFQVQNPNSTVTDKTHEDIPSARIYEPSIIPANKWTKIKITFTTNDLADSNFQVYPRYNIAANVGELYFRDCKLEKGNQVTPWIPNISDEEYNKLGYNNNNVIYDTSGYGYDMTINGSPTCSTDTPRNSTCMNFISPSNAYCTKFSPTGYTNNYTVSFWAIYKANNSMAFGHSNGNRLNLYFNSSKILWNTGDSNNNPFQNNGTDISNTPYMNSWHHYVITADGTSNKLYIDGEYVGTAKTFRPLTGTTLVLSGWSTDTSVSYRLGDKISDFRLYSTALSEEDIKELYQVGTNIDKNGNVFAYEFKED